MVYIVGFKRSSFNLFHCKVSCELVNHCANHFKMPQLLSADICKQPGNFPVWHRISLRDVTHRSTKLAVRSTILTDYHSRQSRVRLFYFNRVFKSLFIIPHISSPPFPKALELLPTSSNCRWKCVIYREVHNNLRTVSYNRSIYL